MTSIPIGNDAVVALHFVLTNAEGEQIDDTHDGDPVLYLHGAGHFVPGVERALEGHHAGDTLTVTVSPADGFGEREGDGPRAVPRSAFPADVELDPGMEFVAEGEDGQEVTVWIIDVQNDKVVIDMNHPLAGQTLTFAVEVLSVRPATATELAHGHAHGPNEHQH